MLVKASAVSLLLLFVQKRIKVVSNVSEMMHKAAKIGTLPQETMKLSHCSYCFKTSNSSYLVGVGTDAINID